MASCWQVTENQGFLITPEPVTDPYPFFRILYTVRLVRLWV
ncbi:MAG: hypothetical protein Ct9H300mP13_1340 [Gammaproteobacteria bacterium]|nr:MAG: hypothetical protein Ct9H300mP13_1340 [Gammaproteobacteria bacterium]